MKWNWNKNQEKQVEYWLASLKNERNEITEMDFICNVRSGELCFDLVERETDPLEYKLFADLYVGGINSGYGYGLADYPYDYADEICGVWNSEKFAEMNLDEFKNFINAALTEIIENNPTYKNYSLIEKANLPLRIW